QRRGGPPRRGRRAARAPAGDLRGPSRRVADPGLTEPEVRGSHQGPAVHHLRARAQLGEGAILERVPGLLLAPERGETAATPALAPPDARRRRRTLGPALEPPQPGARPLPADPCPRERLARLEQTVLGVAVCLLAQPVQLVLVSSLGLAQQTLASRGQRPL